MKLETLEYKRGVRMSELGASIKHRLPELGVNLLGALTAMLSTVGAMTAAFASANGRLQELSRSKAAARTALRSDVEAIYRTARAIAMETPGFDAKFRLSLRSDQKLLTAARSAAQDTAPLASTFIGHAMAESFLETLNFNIGNFEKACQDCSSAARIRDVGAREIETAMRQVRSTAKRFDAVVRNALSGDAPALASWDKACHFGRAKPVRRSAGTTAAAPTATEP